MLTISLATPVGRKCQGKVSSCEEFPTHLVHPAERFQSPHQSLEYYQASDHPDSQVGLHLCIQLTQARDQLSGGHR